MVTFARGAGRVYRLRRDAHHVMPEDVSFFVEHLGWTTPPVYEPEDELIEEWRAKIADYDARRALELVGR
jgi:hypothetical protein